ncbi:MAG TPA: GDP-mannose 4,6-dehydratase [Solirubrobacteraceae bacterium]|nr:GDP-mannose 4,6-dehydratase [Solirubrobacteraceae bacterium]
MRALVTGASGLAGGWLCNACVQDGDEVLGVSRSGTVPGGICEAVALDLDDADALTALVARWAPDIVYHLAALSSVGRSWHEPGVTLAANVSGALHVLEAVRTSAPAAHVLWVSSCEVYGAPSLLPTPELAPYAPANPYAVSKAAGEMLADVYASSHGLRITCVRPYNHAGPRQRPMFLLSNLARQGAVARLGGASTLKVVTGNPDTRRDFTDVRDTVRAYRLLAATAPAPGPMSIYNVCSGRSISTADQVATLARLLDPIEVEHAVDPARVRASEVIELCGDPAKLTAATGWRPTIGFEQTMADTIAWWESQLARAT